MGISSSYAKAFDNHPFWTTIFSVWAVTKVIRAVGQAAGTYKEAPMTFEITAPSLAKGGSVSRVGAGATSMTGLGHGGGGHGGRGWGGGGWGYGPGWGGPEYIPYPVIVPVGVVEGGTIPDEVIAQETAGLGQMADRSVSDLGGSSGLSWTNSQLQGRPGGIFDVAHHEINSMDLHTTSGAGRKILQAYGSDQNFKRMIQSNPLTQQTEAKRIAIVLNFMDTNSVDAAYDWVDVPPSGQYSRPYFRSVLRPLQGMLGDIAARNVAARQARGH
jgi:hypothetical protein